MATPGSVCLGVTPCDEPCGPDGRCARDSDTPKETRPEWLATYLADAGGPVKAGVIQEDAKQYGMAAKTLRRAADDMGVVKNPPGGGRNCTWDLPDDVKELMGLLPDEGEAETSDTTDEAPAVDFDALEAEFANDEEGEGDGDGVEA